MMRFEIKKNNKWVYIAMNALLMLLIFARHMYGIDIPEVVFICLTMAMVCSLNRDQLLATLIMCIPLSSIFTTHLVVIVGILMWVLLCRERMRIGVSIVPLLLMVLWELTHCFEADFSIKVFITRFTPLLLCGLLMWHDISDVDYGFVVRCLSLCTMTLCLTLLGVVLVRSGFNMSVAFANMHRLGWAAEYSSADTLHINPNSLGIICVLATSGLMQLLSIGQGKLVDIIMALTMVTCGALTTSRTFLALLIIMVVLLWLSQSGGLQKKLRFLLLLAIIAVVAIIVLNAVFPIAIENFVKRMNSDDISSGRTSLLHIYNQFLYSNPDVLLFGIGATNFYNEVMVDYAVAINVPHNGIQEMVVAWGIPGLVLFLVFLGTMLWRAKKIAGKQRLLNYIPLILLIAKIQVGQMLTSYYTMLAFAFCYLSLAHNFEPNQQTHPVKRKFYKKTLDN